MANAGESSTLSALANMPNKNTKQTGKEKRRVRPPKGSAKSYESLKTKLFEFLEENGELERIFELEELLEEAESLANLHDELNDSLRENTSMDTREEEGSDGSMQLFDEQSSLSVTNSQPDNSGSESELTSWSLESVSGCSDDTMLPSGGSLDLQGTKKSPFQIFCVSLKNLYYRSKEISTIHQLLPLHTKIFGCLQTQKKNQKNNQ